MSEQSRRYYVIHDDRGRILGLAPAAAEQPNDKIGLGYRPVPQPNQTVTELELTREQAATEPHELLQLEVARDPQSGRPHLRRPRSSKD